MRILRENEVVEHLQRGTRLTLRMWLLVSRLGLFSVIANVAFGQAFFDAAPTRVNGMQPQAQAQMTCAADGQAVDSSSGLPVVRAHVTGSMGNGGNTATTDSQGRWSLTGLPCGRVQIFAQKSGYMMSNYGQGKPGRPFRPVQLQDGSPAHDLKIEMTPQGVVAGKVVDENGDPVQNVQIQLIASGVQEGKRQWQQRGGSQTNDLGEYRIHGLNAGKYVVCARGNGNQFGFVSQNNQREVYTETCYPGPVEGGSASTLDLQPGREAKVDFTLTPTQGATLRGTIAGGTRNGIGMQLRKRQSTFQAIQPTRVNFLPDGRFEITGVAPGSYYLTANIWDQNNRSSGEIPVDVNSGDVEGLVLQLAPGFAFTGTVKIESTHAGDPAPVAVAGNAATFSRVNGNVSVNGNLNQGGIPLNLMLRSNEGVMGMGSQIKWSDDKRSFTMTDVMAGRYKLEVNPMGPYYVKSIRLQGHDVLNEELNLQQASGPYEIVLSDDSGKVQGTLKGGDGQPATGQITLIPDNGARPHYGFAGPEGNFTAMNVPPGNYKAYAWSDPQEAEFANPDWMRQFGGDGISLSVTPGQTAKLDLKQTVMP